jgi:hypothetical protein
MPDVLSPLAPKLANKPKKTRTAHQALKGARICVKSKPRPAVVAANIPYVSAFAIGDHISHPQFGGGTVTQIDAAKLMIKFASCGTKQIIDSYVERRTAG